jgi:hypothetical protein
MPNACGRSIADVLFLPRLVERYFEMCGVSVVRHDLAAIWFDRQPRGWARSGVWISPGFRQGRGPLHGPADRHRGRPCLTTMPPHKHPKVLAWLSRHSRWIFHFTPTSALGLNAVENFLSEMTRQFVRRGVPTDCRSVGCHQRLLAQHNAQRQTVRLDQNRRGNPGQTR